MASKATSTTTPNKATASSSSSVTGTPQRPNNNYAAPHTPIASVKRPRQQNGSGSSTPTTTPRSSSDVVRSPSMLKTPSGRRLDPHPEEEVMGEEGKENLHTSLSPMHPPRPVIRDEAEADGTTASSSTNTNASTLGYVSGQVGALFSPMLSFLNPGSSQKEDADDDIVEGVESSSAQVTDEGEDNNTLGDDASYEKDVTMANSTSTTEAADDEEEEDDVQEVALDTQVATAAAHTNGHHQHHEEEEDDEEEFNPYFFIHSLPAYETVRHLTPRVALPTKDPAAPPITLVLDLDETLVHCTVEIIPDADLQFPVLFHGTEYQVYVRLRPHLYEFLEAVHTKFEVVVFTASQRVYADELLNRIDPNQKYIQHRMFRESCLAVEGNFLKDLHVLGRDLRKAVLVDNSPHAFGYQYDNGIPIESWFDDPHDTELLKLRDFLLHDLMPAANKDVRTVVRHAFQTHHKVQQAAAAAVSASPYHQHFA